MTQEKKTTIQFILSFIIAFIGLGLIFASFIVPPLGVIHSSVLAAFGEILTFSGAILGIDYTYRKQMLMHEKANDNEKE